MDEQSPFKLELEDLWLQLRTFLKNPLVIGLAVLFLISVSSSVYILFNWNSPVSSTVPPANFVLSTQKPTHTSPSPVPDFTPTPLASPTSTPTPQVINIPWLTYSNTVEKYSLKYPPDWSLSDTGSTDPLVTSFVIFYPSTQSASLDPITISTTTRTSVELATIYGSSSAQVLTIASQSANEYDSQNSDGVQSVSIVLPGNNFSFIFYALKQYRDLLLQMLNTFSYSSS